MQAPSPTPDVPTADDHAVDTTAAVSCRNVHKAFDQTPAVAGVSLDVSRGSIVSLLGPSGCGKTTMLRLIAGFERPDVGTIALGERIVASQEIDVAPEKRRVGMVFQDYALFPHLTVGRNVAYGLAHVPRRERSGQVAAALELVGLTGLDSRKPSELSGGQQQRVALARALAPKPDVVLMDEPFSNLDASLRATVRSDVRRILKEAGTTAVLVTHDQAEAMSVSDTVAVMHAGMLHQVADPQTLYRSPATPFVATFVGEAEIISGTRNGDMVETVLGRLRTNDLAGGSDVDVLIRPESLRVAHDGQGAGQITSIEYFGHDQLLTLQLLDGSVLRARLGPAQRFELGDTVSVGVVGPVATFG